MDDSLQSVIPMFLYSSSSSSKNLIEFEHLIAKRRNSSSSLSPPSELGMEMFSPAYYAACSIGGIFSCGLTHMAVTPLDLIKCNMQVGFYLNHLFIWMFDVWVETIGWNLWMWWFQISYSKVPFTLLNTIIIWFRIVDTYMRRRYASI